MLIISEAVVEVLEYAYNTQKECNEHAKQKIKDGFKVTSKYHDVCRYYRKFEKTKILTEMKQTEVENV
jgi:hypothetical protein